MNWYELMYKLAVLDNVRQAFDVATVVFACFSVVLILQYIITFYTSTDITERVRQNAILWIKFFLVGFTILILMRSVIPTRREVYLTAIGGSALEYLSGQTSIPPQVSNYVLTELELIARKEAIELSLQQRSDSINLSIDKLNQDIRKFRAIKMPR